MDYISHIYSTLKNAFQLENITIKARVIIIEYFIVIILVFLEPTSSVAWTHAYLKI
jgi:hypothetical protein